jgi:organic hydroperoxide reductase OsmC/OhrA
MPELKTAALFIGTALAEIVGCYLPYMASSLRSMIARRGGKAARVRVTATVTAEKGADGIEIRSSHLQGVVEGLEGLDAAALQEVAQAVEEGCTISNAIRARVSISHEVRAD